MLQSFLPRFVIICIGVMPFFAPSFISFGWISTSPELLKTAWGISFVSIGLLWWIFNQFKSNNFEIVKSDLYLPIFGFLLWCFISLIWVEDGYLAALMLAQFSSFVLIFVLIVNTFKHFDWVVVTLRTLVLSMTLVSIIGLLQYYFPDNWNIQNMFMQSARPGATFANKNMASHFIVMTLPLSLIFLLVAKTHFKIALYSFTTFIGGWFLIYTVARQAYLAVAVELLILGVFIALDSHKNNHQSLLSNLINKSMKKIALIGVVISLALVSNLTDKGWDFSFGDKAKKIQDISVEGGSIRYPAWVNTIEMIKDNPIVGVGVGQWPQAYPLYYDRIMKDTIFNEQVRLRHLHNDYLEIFANVGLIGYLFLIWLLFLIGKKVLGVLSDINNPYRIYILGVSLSLVGFSIVAMFSFPIKVYLPAFLVFVYFAIILLSTKTCSAEGSIIKHKLTRRSYAGLILIVSLAVFSLHQSYRWLMSDWHINNAVLLTKLDMNKRALSAGMRALEYNSLSLHNYGRVAEILIKMEQGDKAIPYLKKIIDISPYNSKALVMLAGVYSAGNNPNDKIMERKVLEFVLSFDPKNVNALGFLVKNLASNERGKDAVIVYGRLKNAFEYFKDRDGFGPYHHNVGLVAVSVGDYEYAKYVYEDAIDRLPTATNYYNMAILEYDFMKNHKKGVEFARKALETDSDMPRNEEVRVLIEKYESSTQQ